MDKLKRKHSLYQAMKTISYLIGFPLMAVLVYLCSQKFTVIDSAMTPFGKTGWYGVLVVAGIWAAATLLQIVFRLLIRNKKARIALALLVSIGLTLGCAIGIDLYSEKKIDDVREKYAEQGAEVKSYNYQVNWFSPLTSDRGSLTDEFNSRLARFTNVYNIRYTAKKYGDENTDLTEMTYDKKNDIYTGPNGMLADGYVFSTNKALDILITYHETQASYKKQGKNADDELAAAINALESQPSSEWNQYKLTEEYISAYGPNGEAYKYMLTLDRLDLILSALGRELKPSLTGADLILGNFDGLSDYVDLIGYINSDLSVDVLIAVIDSLDLFEEPPTRAFFEDLLKGFSFYQSPKTRPIFSFIEDEALREYAFAKYYATLHGAKVGSVLIGDYLGKVTMDNKGFPSDYGFTLTELYQLRADLEYIPVVYPLMAARRFLYVFAGIIGLSIVLTAHYADKQKQALSKLLNGGRK